MKTLTQYKEDIAGLMAKVGDIDAQATTENRKVTEVELSLKTELLDEVESLDSVVKTMERQNRIADILAKPEERKTVEHSLKKTPGIDVLAKDRFNSFGNQLASVMRAGLPGGSVDPRLYNAAEGMNETTPSDGGFLVQQEFSTELLQNMWADGEILPKISKTTLSGNKNGMVFNGLDETSRVDGSRAGGIQAFWGAEAADKTKSKPTFRQIDLKLNKLIGLAYGTDELLDDVLALAQTINDGFRKEFNFKITDAIINGSGAGQPLGILNSGCVVSVGKEAGQGAGTILYDNINKMWSRIMASSRPNSVWVINQDCETELNKMSVAVGTGGVPVYMPAGGVSVQPYSTLFGRPVIPIEQCQTVGTTGDIMLCDFSEYKAIDKGGIKSDVSIHVEFVSDQSAFRFVYRFDGQPVLGQPITPYKGTNTLSHFVKLDTRA